MWEPLDEPAEDWQPQRTRWARPIRLLALVVVAAMVLALVIPAVLRLLRSGGDEPQEDDTVVAQVVAVSVVHLPSDTSWP